MKKLKGLRKRWYMLRDLLGIPSKKYNYKNNYTKLNKQEIQIEENKNIDFLEKITFLKHKDDSDIIKEFYKNFDTSTWNFYGKDRKFLKGVDAAPGVTEQTLTQLYNILQKDKNKNKILSIGCGMRNGLKFLEFLGFDAYGIDFDVPQDKQTEKLKFHNLNENDFLPFKDQMFDVILCQEVIEHIENPWLLFRKVKKVLKKDGIFLLTTPNVNCKEAREIYYKNLDGYTIHFNKDMTWYHINPLHYFELKHIINYYNFDILNITGNRDYYVEYEEPSDDWNNVVNRNDVIHFILKNNDNETPLYIPKPTYR